MTPNVSPRLTRRQLLRSLAGLGGLALVTACSQQPAAPAQAPAKAPALIFLLDYHVADDPPLVTTRGPVEAHIADDELPAARGWFFPDKAVERILEGRIGLRPTPDQGRKARHPAHLADGGTAPLVNLLGKGLFDEISDGPQIPGGIHGAQISLGLTVPACFCANHHCC